MRSIITTLVVTTGALALATGATAGTPGAMSTTDPNLGCAFIPMIGGGVSESIIAGATYMRE